MDKENIEDAVIVENNSDINENIIEESKLKKTINLLKKIKPAVWYWIIAVIISITAMIYQKKTGPTYPDNTLTTLNNNTYELELIRSHGGEKDCELKYEIDDNDVSGSVFYKRFKSEDDWTEVQFNRDGDFLVANLPHQPPAGKLSYYLHFKSTNDETYPKNNNPVVIRFKGAVPNNILIPHVIFMILTLLFSMVSAVFAVANHKNYKIYGYIAFGFLIIGGLILGPIVQKYAFNELWAGVPFGWDLTDNKTLIMFLAWLGAFILHKYKPSRWYFVLATIIVMGVYAIPHSAMGSELDYKTGKIGQSELNK